MGREFANGPGDLGSVPGRVIPKTLKMVLDTPLLNTQRYKVRIEGKVEQSRERSSALPLHFDVEAIEKGAFWSLSTMFANFTFYFFFLCQSEFWSCPWCNGYRPRKCTRRHEFKSWTRLIAFHIALIPLGKVWIQLFSLQLWVNSRAD